MVEAEDANSNRAKKEKTALSKIEPVKIETTSKNETLLNNENVSTDSRIEIEKSIISATILLLREHGIRKSGAAVRDAVDISHQCRPKEAVSSLSNFGFKASFGRLNIANLSEEFFPLIAFKKNGEASIVLTAPIDGKIVITNPISRKRRD